MSLENDIFALFPDARRGTGYFRVKCPFHKGGQERRPSMSIITEEGHNGMHLGYCKCFTCGWEGPFTEVAEHFGMQYVPDTSSVEPPQLSKPTFKVTTQPAVYKKDTPYQYSPYLASRGISEEVQRLFKVYEKPEEHKVYLPVFNREGQYLFANARATNKKLFFLPYGVPNALAYIEEVDFNRPIAICESQINALTLWTSQFCKSVATLGATKISLLRELKNAAGPFLLMYDGDKWGKKATKETIDFLGAHRCITFEFLEGEDVNSLWQACNFNSDLFFDELEKRRQ